MTRRPQLDALRGIAAALVVIHHWTTWGIGLDLGNVGVQLFFVLSGFLITGILLDQRNRLEAGEISLWRVLSSFFERRAVRIWPVMFLTLAIVWLAGDGFERREDMLWHVLFGSNVLFFLRGEFGSSLAHFWSLAVEQQFYLAWPFLILFAPKKYLETVILALIVIAPLSRMALAAHGFTHFAQFNVLPFANFDSLGLGALMALWLRRSATEVAERWSVLNWAALMSLAGLVASPWATVPGNVEQTLYAVLFALLIVAAFRGIGGTVGRLLENPMLVALGTISYGVYVYHMFAPRIVGAVLRKFEAPLVLHSGLPLFLFSAFLTLVVATLSWRLMEAPILSLGKRSSQSVSRFRPMPQPK